MRVKTFSVFDCHEFLFDLDGGSCLVIYGSHVNGGFIALPTYHVAVDASRLDMWGDTAYNIAALKRCGLSSEVSKAISRAVRDHYRDYISSLAGAGECVWKHFDGNGFCVSGGEVIAHYEPTPFPGHYHFFSPASDDIQVLACTPDQIALTVEKHLLEKP